MWRKKMRKLLVLVLLLSMMTACSSQGGAGAADASKRSLSVAEKSALSLINKKNIKKKGV